MTDNLPSSPSVDFESIKYIDEHGVEYWDARELLTILGYSEWRNFADVVRKAQIACINSGQDVENHFVKFNKMVSIGYGNPRPVESWKLDRYACYLIAQNGNSNKKEISLAQTYFAIQTRRQEVFDQLSEDGKRLMIRDEVSSHNKELASTAKKAGVSKFGLFNDAGYRGLYGMGLSDIERKKGIKRGELLDRAGATELAANLFRITQTDEKLKKDNTVTEYQAIETHKMVGRKVRKTIVEIGGILPEDLQTERHISKVKKDLRELQKPTTSLLPDE